MRQRAISAAVLVPVLLVVLFFGGVVLAGAVASITVFAAVEAFRLLRSAGHEGFAALGTVLALFVVLAAVASFTRVAPHDGLQAWMATVFGALYVAMLSFIVRLGQEAPVVPDTAPFHALGAEQGWVLLLVLAVWSYDTGAYLVGESIGRTDGLTHMGR